jgi:aspartate racemase
MQKKLLGIVGGLGPLATVILYEMIVKYTQAKTDQEHIDIIIYNHASVPDRTDFILGKSKENPLPYMIDDVRKLEEFGADLIIIPCNTAHYFYDQIASSVKIPVINMIREAIIETSNQKISKVGLMATTGTIETKLYQKECIDYQIECVIPSSKNQELVMDIIYNNVKAGKDINYDNLLRIIDEFEQKGCTNVILGCTELSVIEQDKKIKYNFIDAMKVLAIRAIERCGKRSKKG